MLDVPKGDYVIAVSGGVDSMALLDIVRRKKDVKLVVAHVNHGIRKDSYKDRQLVQDYCNQHGLRFIAAQLNLGVRTSEDKARQARYAFLRDCLKTYNAQKIITAHHQDDLLETAIINLLRGTGWRGLAPFVSTADVLRPALHLPKQYFVDYAQKNNIPWRQDSTNANQAYLRNFVRYNLLPKLNLRDKNYNQTMLGLIDDQQKLRPRIEGDLTELYKAHSSVNNNQVSFLRYDLVMLPSNIAAELLQKAVQQVCGHSLQKHLLKSSLLFAKTGGVGKTTPLCADCCIVSSAKHLTVQASLRVTK